VVMINCKVMDELGEIERVVDVDNGFKIETNVNDFSTTVFDDNGVFAFVQHENLEIALECQRQLSKAIHH